MIEELLNGKDKEIEQLNETAKQHIQQIEYLNNMLQEQWEEMDRFKKDDLDQDEALR